MTSEGRGRHRVAQVVALVLAVLAAGALLVLPTYSSTTETSDGQVVRSSETLVEVNGSWVIALLLVPVVLTAIPLLVRGRAELPTAVVATVLLGLGVLISIFTIGVFFLPALFAAVVGLVFAAIGATRRTHPETQPAIP